MNDFIQDSMNSWKSYDAAGNPQIFVNDKGDLDVSGNRLANSSEYSRGASSVNQYLKGDENVGLSDGTYNQQGKRKN